MPRGERLNSAAVMKTLKINLRLIFQSKSCFDLEVAAEEKEYCFIPLLLSQFLGVLSILNLCSYSSAGESSSCT